MELIKRRARRPKVRTGCVTCKLRRVKCDEGKPACFKCSSTGRNCDGYEAIWGLAKYRSPSTSSISSHTISFDIEGDEQERRSFCFFRSRAAHAIAGYLPSYFWETLVLQASHANPAILHAVVALGSLYESYQETQPAWPESDRRPEKRQFALEQSNKAISHLRTQIKNAAPRSGDTVLMTCLLFTCLEIFQGNIPSAMQHLNSGLKILGQWLREEEPSFCPGMEVTRPNRSFVESSLIPIFARLDIQASTVMTSRPLHCELFWNDLDVSQTPPMPESFSSVTEASDSLLKLVYTMFHHQQVAQNLYNPTRQGSPYSCPEGLAMMFLTAREENRAQLDLWLAALNSLLKNSSSSMSMRDLRASVLLKMHFLFVAIMLGASGANDETKFDNYTAEFRQMLRLADSLLAPSTQMTQTGLGHKPSYLFDPNIIPPLYMAATRCRDPVLRRKALELLWNLKSREGIWDSEICHALGKWVMEKEEEGLECIEGPQSVPVEKRVSLFGKGFICGQRRILIKYRQGSLVPGEPATTREAYTTY